MNNNQLNKSSYQCRELLSQWMQQLRLTNYEKERFKLELEELDNHINHLVRRKLQLCVFGRVGVGKSSLLNALIEKEVFHTDIAHGCTQKEKRYRWDAEFENLDCVEFIDTPGIEEVNAKEKFIASPEIALKSDLILFVIDSDLTKAEQEALRILLKRNKPILLILNRCDQWKSDEIKTLLKSIRNRPPLNSKKLEIMLVASSPRHATVNPNGKVRSDPDRPKVNTLRNALKILIDKRGDLIMAINSLNHADQFYKCLKEERLRKNKLAAQGLIGKFAALKASGVAANPVVLMDFAAGFACDVALVLQLSKVYGIDLGGASARQLVKKLSLHNASLGGAQIGIQLTLSTLQKILIAASPLTGGLSLAPATPVAIAQAAIAVHTTKITGRLAARKFLKSSDRRNSKPTLMLKQLMQKELNFNILLYEWSHNYSKTNKELKVLLP